MKSTAPRSLCSSAFLIPAVAVICIPLAAARCSAQSFSIQPSLWLDAGVGVVTEADNTWSDQAPRVVSWTDRSSNARVFTPLSGTQWFGLQAPKDLPAVMFNRGGFSAGPMGVTDVPGSTLFGQGSATVLMVLAPDTFVNGYNTSLGWGDGAAADRFLIHSTHSGAFHWQFAGGGTAAETPTWRGAWHLLETSATGGSHSIRLDGQLLPLTHEETASAPVDLSATLMVGGDAFGNNFKGTIAEILVFPQALTGSDLSSVEGYLNGKYGLTAVPEPSTYGLAFGGTMACWAFVRARRRDARVAQA